MSSSSPISLLPCAEQKKTRKYPALFNLVADVLDLKDFKRIVPLPARSL